METRGVLHERPLQAMGCIVRVLHVDVHVLSGLPEGERGGRVVVAHVAHLSVSSPKHNMPVEHDDFQTVKYSDH